MPIGASEAETFWTEFLRGLVRRGLRGVQLVISDAHVGLQAAITKVLRATWQRCRVHAMRNLLAHAGRQGRGWWRPSSAPPSRRKMPARRGHNGARSRTNCAPKRPSWPP